MPLPPPVMTADRGPSSRSVHESLLRCDEDVLDLGEGVEGVGAELPADARLLEPAERRPVAHRRVRVDRQVAALDGPGDAQGPADVPRSRSSRTARRACRWPAARRRPRRRTGRRRRPGRTPPRRRPGRSARTGASTVGGNHQPGPSGAVAPEGDRRALRDEGRHRRRGAPAEISGPISVAGGVGSPTGDAARRPAPAAPGTGRRPIARRGCVTGRSSPARRCRTRPSGAVAAARSRSASANTMLALLPPSSSVTRFTWAAQPAMMPPADLGRAGEHDLAHVGVVDEALADDRALARQDLEHVGRDPGVERQLGQAQCGQRRQLGRLEHHACCRRPAPGRTPTPRSASGSSRGR